MKNIVTAAVAALALVVVAVPAMAQDTPHLDVTTTYTAPATKSSNLASTLSESLRLSQTIKKVTLFADVAANEINGSNSLRNPSLTFKTGTADVGATLNLSRVTSVTAVYGTTVNDARVLKSEALTNRFVGVSATTRVF